MNKIFGRFENLRGEEVSKMKNLIMIVAALAIALSFLPKAEAGDTAGLGLSVTFKLEPLRLWTDPAGPFLVHEGEELKFKVIAEDLDASSVTLKAGPLPEGATFVLARYWAPTNHMEGTFTWTPDKGQAKVLPYQVEFMATSSNEETGLGMIVKITVKPAPVISIELEPTTWVLEDVKMGEKRENLNEFGATMHKIFNRGNVPVLVDIGYGPQIQDYPSVRPGLEQGKDIFTTEVGMYLTSELKVLPPNERVKIGSFGPTEGMPLRLVYGAPTELSSGIKDHGAKYELRAYGEIVEE